MKKQKTSVSRCMVTAAAVLAAVVLGTMPAFADIVVVKTDKALTIAVVTVAMVIIIAIAVLRGIIRKKSGRQR